jgi:ActR/RegA family two-component response regulator
MPRVLIVDDNPTHIFTLSRYFGARGYDVGCAQNTEEANAFLAKGCPEVLIVDVSLEGASNRGGLNVITQFREQCPHLLIVVLTAYGTAEVEVEAERRGANIFFYKPLPLSDLEKSISSLIGHPFGA